MPAEALACSLVSGSGGLSGLLTHEKPARNAFTRGWSNYPLSPMEAPVTVVGNSLRLCRKTVENVFGASWLRGLTLPHAIRWW